ncbi:TPA: hypothetical protein U5D81_004403 [Yersinia enterocolitica]|uniref:hypothetical protein n=1 Tax=Enterobacteriaceae TaxID=543 RepID=UPI0009BD001E|nr:hypothetical protein [Kosakonia radicincitans]ECP1962662.1 hypothetical protein [Salmonella enterica]BBV68957.1 hypothetical protein STW0522KLE44_P40040 [Klebsiella sp. STW0522-44]HBZ9730042.1 hypothetical protein [Citrobacter farmeri]HCG2938420.1 hypothetical protein [Escherichia coli]HEN3403113.1 hypothetical protein [Yersinia enterocolitica]
MSISEQDNAVQTEAKPASPLTIALSEVFAGMLSEYLPLHDADKCRTRLQELGVNTQAVTALMRSTLWHTPTKKYMHLKGNEVLDIVQNDFNLLERPGVKLWRCNQAVKDILSEQGVGTVKKIEEFRLKMAKAIREAISGELRYSQQAKQVRLEIDMFAQEPRLKKERGGAVFYLCHTPYGNFDKDGNPAGYDQAIADDYLDHFPTFPAMLDAIVAARFASSRKSAYILLQAISDWGKDFLLGPKGVFASLGVAICLSEKDVIKILSGANSGHLAEEFLGCLMLVINEPTQVTKIQYRLEESLTITSKFLAAVNVPLFTKIFTSADPVPGLSDADGVDSQIANRFAQVKGDGDIKLRPLFMQDKGHYFDNLCQFTASEINSRIAEYVAMGEKVARKAADDALGKWHQKHGIANHAGDITASYEQVREAWYAFALDRVVAKHPDFIGFNTVGGFALRSSSACWTQFVDWYAGKEDGIKRQRLLLDRDVLIGSAKVRQSRSVNGKREGGSTVLLPEIPMSIPDNVKSFKR